MRRVTISCIVALLVGAGVARTLGQAGTPTASAPRSCGTPCAAAYRAIARALPRDRADTLAQSILATPGFDYRRLAQALGIPTAAQLRADWRRRCNARYPDDRARAGACYALILASTYRRLGTIPALTA
jgi:hypothetical protein